MSPEVKVYAPIKKEAPSKKVEYTKSKNWGVSNNRRQSNVGVWRK